jgi:hypothetical protein
MQSTTLFRLAHVGHFDVANQSKGLEGRLLSVCRPEHAEDWRETARLGNAPVHKTRNFVSSSKLHTTLLYERR